MLATLLTAVAIAAGGDGVDDKEKINPHLRRVERAAMIFRIRLYEKYRLQRPLYDQYRKAGDEFFHQFEVSDQSNVAANDAVAWFENATHGIRRGGIGILPATPMLPRPSEPLVEVYGDEKNEFNTSSQSQYTEETIPSVDGTESLDDGAFNKDASDGNGRESANSSPDVEMEELESAEDETEVETSVKVSEDSSMGGEEEVKVEAGESSEEKNPTLEELVPEPVIAIDDDNPVGDPFDILNEQKPDNTAQPTSETNNEDSP